MRAKLRYPYSVTFFFYNFYRESAGRTTGNGSTGAAHSLNRIIIRPLSTGVLLGDFTAMACSLLGLGAILAASAMLFVILKWVGALYLVYLGIKLWRTSHTHSSAVSLKKSGSVRSLFKSAFIVTALNPKSIAFFVAFLPQFISPMHASAPQLLVLGSTFLVLATINAALYAYFAGELSEMLKKNAVRRWLDRCGGSALIGAGVLTAAMQRSS